MITLLGDAYSLEWCACCDGHRFWRKEGTPYVCPPCLSLTTNTAWAVTGATF